MNKMQLLLASSVLKIEYFLSIYACKVLLVFHK